MKKLKIEVNAPNQSLFFSFEYFNAKHPVFNKESVKHPYPLFNKIGFESHDFIIRDFLIASI